MINKAGGLVYNKTFHENGLKKISTNDLLVLAGTFHGYVEPCQEQNEERSTRDVFKGVSNLYTPASL